MRYFIHSILITTACTSAIAAPIDNTQMTQLISSPPQKLLYCAHKGVLAYQTALSLNYLFGRQDLKKSYIKAYGWSLVVGHRLQQAGDTGRLAYHRKLEAALRKKIDNPKIVYNGKQFAIKLWDKYGKDWPVYKAADMLPKGCGVA